MAKKKKSRALPKWISRSNNSKATSDIHAFEDTDIIIPIMGPTGAGKSSFINAVMGEEVMKVGHRLASCTSTINHCFYNLDGGRRVVLVDTPGFDDTYTSDVDILKSVASWLAISYSEDKHLAGIIYMHEISQTRMFGTTLKNLEMFTRLCGEDSLRNVIITTSKWELVEQSVGEEREAELSEIYWKDMMEHKATKERFRDADSARQIVKKITDVASSRSSGSIDALGIQKELIEARKFLPDTDAGRTLRYTLEEFARMKEGDPDKKKVLEKIRTQIKELRVPFSLRFLSFFDI